MDHGPLGLVNPEVVVPAGAARHQDPVAGRRQARADDPSLRPSDLSDRPPGFVEPEQAHLAGEPIVQMHHGPVSCQGQIGSVLHDGEGISRYRKMPQRELRGPDRRRHQRRPVQQMSCVGVDGLRTLGQFDGRADFAPCHAPRHQHVPIGHVQRKQQHFLVVRNGHGRQAVYHSAASRGLIDKRPRSASQGRHAEHRPADRGIDDEQAIGAPSRARDAQARFVHQHGQLSAAQAELAQAGAAREAHEVAVGRPKDQPRALCPFHSVRLVAVQRLNPERAAGAARAKRDVPTVRRDRGMPDGLPLAEAARRSEREATGLPGCLRIPARQRQACCEGGRRGDGAERDGLPALDDRAHPRRVPRRGFGGRRLGRRDGTVH